MVLLEVPEYKSGSRGLDLEGVCAVSTWPQKCTVN